MSRRKSHLEEKVYLGYRVSVRLVHEAEQHYKPYPINNASDVYKLLSDLQTLDREHFYALHLDTKNRLTSCEEVSKGCLSWAVVHPREVYKAAILTSAASLIIAHNHPSGDPTPSPQDHDITKRLRDAGELLGIPLLDSIIIGHNGYHSMREAEEI